MIEPDDVAQGLSQAIQDTKRNPDLDSDAILQPVGPHSPVDRIIAFGRIAYGDVRRGSCELEQ